MATVRAQQALAFCVSALLGADGQDAGGFGSTPEPPSLTFASLRDGAALSRLLRVRLKKCGGAEGGEESLANKEAVEAAPESSASTSGSSSFEASTSAPLRAKLGLLADVRDAVQASMGGGVSMCSDRSLLRARSAGGDVELAQLVSMVLASLVQGAQKERFIKRIMEMDVTHQGEIMEAIKSVLPRDSGGDDLKSPAATIIGRLTPRHRSNVSSSKRGNGKVPGQKLFGEEPNNFNDENTFTFSPPQKLTDASNRTDSPVKTQTNARMLARLRTLEQENLSLQKSNETMSATVARQKAQIETCRADLDRRTKDQHRALEQSENRAAEKIFELQGELEAAMRRSQEANAASARFKVRAEYLEAAEDEACQLRAKAEEASKLQTSLDVAKRRLEALGGVKQRAAESQAQLNEAARRIAALEAELPRKDAALRSAEENVSRLEQEKSALADELHAEKLEAEALREHCDQLSASAKEWLGGGAAEGFTGAGDLVERPDPLAGMPSSLVEFFSRASVTPSRTSSTSTLSSPRMQGLDEVGTPRAAQRLMQRWTTANGHRSSSINNMVSSPANDYLCATPHTPRHHVTDRTPIKLQHTPDATLSLRLSRLEEQNQELQKARTAEAEASTMRASELNSQIRAERARGDALESRLSEKEAEATSTSQRLMRELAAKTKQAEKAENLLQSASRESREKIARLEQELAEAKITGRAFQEEAETLRAELHAAKADFRSQKEAMRTTQLECENRARALQTEFRLHQEDSTRALSFAETKWQRAEEQIRELRHEASASKEQYERARYQLENTVDTLTAELADSRTEQIRAQQSASTDSAAADASRRELESRVNDAEERCYDAEKRVDSIKRELVQVEESCRARVDTLRRELGEARGEVRVLEASARNELRLSAEKAEESRLLHSREAEKRSVAAAALSTEVARLSALVERLRDEAKAKDTAKRQLEANIEQLRGTIAVHTRAADVARAGRQTAETRNSLLDAELQRWKSKCETVEESRSVLESKLQDAEASARDSRRIAEEAKRAADRARNQAAESEALLLDARLTAKNSQRAWELEEKQFDKDLQSLRDSESGARMARDTAQECLRAAEKEVAALAEALRSRSTATDDASSSPSMVDKEAMAKAVLEAETRVQLAADAKIATLVKNSTADLMAAEEDWEKRLSGALAEAREAHEIAVEKVRKDCLQMTADSVEARDRLDRKLRSKQEELAEKIAEAGVLGAKVQRLQSDLRAAEGLHGRDVQKHMAEQEATLAEVARVSAALQDSQQQLARMSQVQKASEQIRAKLETDLADSVEKECVCVPCKCLAGCNPQRVPRAIVAEEVEKVEPDAPRVEPTSTMSLAKDLESMWMKRVEDRDRVLERQAKWRRKHMDEEMKLVDTVKSLRRRIKDLKQELAARIKAVEMAEAKVRRLEEEGRKNAKELQDMSLVATPSSCVAPASAIKTAVFKQDVGDEMPATGDVDNVGMVEVLQHALGKLQSEFSSWRIQHDTKTGAALNH